MVVEVGVERIEFGRGLRVQPAVLNRADDLPHRQHHPAQLDQILAQPKGLALQASPRVVVREEVVLDRLDAVVEGLHRLEVAVDDDVEQAVHQRADAVLLSAELVEPL